MTATRWSIALAVLACFTASAVQAAPIVWLEPFTLDAPLGPEGLFLDGTHHSAFFAVDAGAPVTVTRPSDSKTVTFEPKSNIMTPGSTSGNGGYFTGGGGTTGDANLDTVFNSHTWQSGGSSFTIEGLTPGRDYALQVLSVGDTRGCCAPRNTKLGDGLGNLSGNLLRQRADVALGFFNADSATQTIQVLPGDGDGTDPGLSAYLVRDVTVVPEPAGIVVALVGLLAAAGLRRRG